VVSYGPAVVPTVTSAGGRLLQLQSRVQLVAANFPQGRSPSEVEATLGANDATVLSVKDLVMCAPLAVDCNRTLATLLVVPSTLSPAP